MPRHGGAGLLRCSMRHHRDDRGLGLGHPAGAAGDRSGRGEQAAGLPEPARLDGAAAGTAAGLPRRAAEASPWRSPGRSRLDRSGAGACRDAGGRRRRRPAGSWAPGAPGGDRSGGRRDASSGPGCDQQGRGPGRSAWLRAPERPARPGGADRRRRRGRRRDRRWRQSRRRAAGSEGVEHQPLRTAAESGMVDGADLAGRAWAAACPARRGCGGEGRVELGKGLRGSGGGALAVRGFPLSTPPVISLGRPAARGESPARSPLGTWWTIAPRASRVWRLACIERWMSASTEARELRRWWWRSSARSSMSAAETLTMPSVLISNVTSIFTSPR